MKDYKVHLEKNEYDDILNAHGSLTAAILKTIDRGSPETPTHEICPNMILDARMQALDMAREMNREGVNLKIAGQAEILRDADGIVDWLMGGGK